MAEKDDAPEINSVDELNRKTREEWEKQQKKDGDQVEPNAVDELNREYQGGEDTAAAQTEAQETSLNPEGGLDDDKK